MNHHPEESSATNKTDTSLERPQAQLIRRLKKKPYDEECKDLFFKFLKGNDFHPGETTDILMAILKSLFIEEAKKSSLIKLLLINGAIFSKQKERESNIQKKINQVRNTLSSFVGDQTISPAFARDILFFKRYAAPLSFFTQNIFKCISEEAVTQNQSKLAASDKASGEGQHLLERIHQSLVKKGQIKDGKASSRFAVIIQAYLSLPSERLEVIHAGFDGLHRLPIELRTIIWTDDCFPFHLKHFISMHCSRDEDRLDKIVSFFSKRAHIDWNQFPPKTQKTYP